MGAIRRVMASPCLSAAGLGFLRRPIPAAGLARSCDGLLGYVPDRNGVPTFRIGKMRWTSWPLDAGSGAPPQPGR
jgi:hypothetical protein